MAFSSWGWIEKRGYGSLSSARCYERESPRPTSDRRLYPTSSSGACANEAELVEACANDSEMAKMFDVKRGWKDVNAPTKNSQAV